jgi:hypothetical protein
VFTKLAKQEKRITFDYIYSKKRVGPVDESRGQLVKKVGPVDAFSGAS